MECERIKVGDCVLIAGGRLKYMTANILCVSRVDLRRTRD